jgi:hypothetical protein
LERPGAVKGAPLFGAAKRTLDGEDRSKTIELEGKDRRKVAGSQFDTNVQNIVVRYKIASSPLLALTRALVQVGLSRRLGGDATLAAIAHLAQVCSPSPGPKSRSRKCERINPA